MNKWVKRLSVISILGILSVLGYVGYSYKDVASVSVIGGVDGPTAIFLASSGENNFYMLGTIGIAIVILGIVYLLYRKSKK